MKKFLNVLVLMVLGVVCFGFTWFVSGGVMDTNMLYNIIFLSLILLLYLVGVVIGFFRIYNLTVYFSHASDMITSLRSDRKLDVPSKVNLLKGYLKIDKKLDEFVTDLRKSQSGICDVEDYVNADEVDSLVHKWYLDLVPDIMSSLGILGTFVGLVWGLRAFDTSGLDTMTSSVSELINGIKVAFLTSIYGLTFSLTFQYSMNKGYSILLNKVQDFLDRFHTCVVPSAEIDAQNRMVHSQKGQLEMLKSLGVEFSETMSGGVIQSLTPVLRKIDTTLEDMVNSQSGTQEAFLQEMSESYRKMSETNISNERIVTILSEICQKTEEVNNAVLESQRDVADTLKSLVEEIKSLSKE